MLKHLRHQHMLEGLLIDDLHWNFQHIRGVYMAVSCVSGDDVDIQGTLLNGTHY